MRNTRDISACVYAFSFICCCSLSLSMIELARRGFSVHCARAHWARCLPYRVSIEFPAIETRTISVITPCAIAQLLIFLIAECDLHALARHMLMMQLITNTRSTLSNQSHVGPAKSTSASLASPQPTETRCERLVRSTASRNGSTMLVLAIVTRLQALVLIRLLAHL